MQLILKFASLPNQSKKYPPLKLKFKINEDSLSRKWAMSLWEILEKPLLLEKQNYLQGFPEAPRGLKEIASDMNEMISLINEYNWNGRYFINERASENMDQETLNILHHHFEVLIGQVWNPAPWYQEAPHEVQIPILFLNSYIHEYEQKKRAIELVQNSKREDVPSMIICAFCMATHHELTSEDKAKFSYERNFGDVFLHYSQLGKTFEEAFNDRDDFIDENNISGLRYYTGEFDIFLGKGLRPERVETYTNEIKAWIKEKGVNPEDPNLALGEIKVAKLLPTFFQRNWDQVRFQEEISKRGNLVEIKLVKFIKRRKAKYPYQSRDTAKLMDKYFKHGQWDRPIEN